MPISGQSAPTVSAARAAYLDELLPAAIPNDLNWLITNLTAVLADVTGINGAAMSAMVTGEVRVPVAAGAYLVPPANRVLTGFGGNSALIDLRAMTEISVCQSIEGTNVVQVKPNQIMAVTMACDGTKVKIKNGAGVESNITYYWWTVG